MRNLFIIGNGFDLAHGLETSYTHFINSTIWSEYKGSNTFAFIAEEYLKTFNWCDLEWLYFDILSNLNEKKYFKVSGRRFYNTVSELNKDFEQIKDLLEKYLLLEQERFVKMKSLEYMFSLFNEDKTLILNFNYTNTVSKYLENNSKLQQINIHGSINRKSSPIIFGFSTNDIESKVLIDKNDNQYLDNIKPFLYKLEKSKTELKRIMDSSQEKFEVFILGHSCGLSDKVILNEIFNHKNTEKIHPFYFKERNGYHGISLNIHRVIDDFDKIEEHKASNKLSLYPECSSFIQYNSDEKDQLKFREFVRKLKSNQKPLPLRNSTKLT